MILLATYKNPSDIETSLKLDNFTPSFVAYVQLKSKLGMAS